MRKAPFIAGIVALLFIFGLLGARMVQSHGGWPGMGHRGGGFLELLTEQQQDILKAEIQEMRDDGANHREIGTAIHTQLQEWGIDPPERGKGRRGHPPFMSDLTEEQKDVINAIRDKMRERGADRKEIRAAIHSQLEEWGIDRPERGKGRRGHPPFMGDLTEGQREIIHAMIDRMRDNGANRREIRAAVHAQLEEWGIDIPGHGEGPHGDWEGDNSRGQRVAEDALEVSCSPNPFNPETQINFTLTEPAEVTMTIYNLAGQRVDEMDLGWLQASEHTVTWNASAIQAASGVYFANVKAGDVSGQVRMSLLK